MFDMKAVWDGMATNLCAEPIAQCGHLPQESSLGQRPAGGFSARLDRRVSDTQ
jgi:hypothetical protein